MTTKNLTDSLTDLLRAHTKMITRRISASEYPSLRNDRAEREAEEAFEALREDMEMDLIEAECDAAGLPQAAGLAATLARVTSPKVAVHAMRTEHERAGEQADLEHARWLIDQDPFTSR